MATRYDLKFQHPRESWDAFQGMKLSGNSFDLLLDHDADVYTPEGDLLLKFRRRVIPSDECQTAWSILRKIRQKSLNRGLATGKLWSGEKVIRKSGYVSRTREVPVKYAVNSNIIGYFDRYVRIPFCRPAAWTAKHPGEWRALGGFFASCASAYREAAADRYEKQMAFVAQTKPEWIIPRTPFTTVTVNRNWQTAVHTDAGDLKAGLSLITAIEAGKYLGGHLVFPHYRVGCDLRSGDLLMFDSHHMHGNTPIIGKAGEWERISCVLYFRERMTECGTSEQELERAKRRRKGDPLYGPLSTPD